MMPCVQASDWSPLPGTYVLLIEVPDACVLAVGALGTCALPAGRYAYVGSARGPGGLRARLARHLAAAKPRRWHVDYLTARFPVTAVLAGADAASRECAWVQALLAIPAAYAPAPGFGNSDCRLGCPAHLVCLPAGYALPALHERLQP